MKKNILTLLTSIFILNTCLSQSLVSTNDTSIESNHNLFIKGQLDADTFYHGYKDASTGTFLATWVLTPIGGLVTAVACSSKHPKIGNLMYPDSELIKKSIYYNGYTQRAWKIKRKKVWTNFGIVFGAEVVVTGILIFIIHPKFGFDIPFTIG